MAVFVNDLGFLHTQADTTSPGCHSCRESSVLFTHLRGHYPSERDEWLRAAWRVTVENRGPRQRLDAEGIFRRQSMHLLTEGEIPVAEGACDGNNRPPRQTVF